MAIVYADDQTFEKEILNGVVLVDFFGPLCSTCKMLDPVLEEVNEEIGNEVKIIKMNVEEDPVTAEEYEIMSIPSLLVFVDGELKEKTAGYLPKEDLIDFIRSNE